MHTKSTVVVLVALLVWFGPTLAAVPYLTLDGGLPFLAWLGWGSVGLWPGLVVGSTVTEGL